jgi:hypothetical protein
MEIYKHAKAFQPRVKLSLERSKVIRTAKIMGLPITLNDMRRPKLMSIGLVGGGDCDLFQGTIAAFSCKDRKKSLEILRIGEPNRHMKLLRPIHKIKQGTFKPYFAPSSRRMHTMLKHNQDSYSYLSSLKPVTVSA